MAEAPIARASALREALEARVL
ncbi:MAG: hypothetical protein RL112_284, partial [Planctomycetota bacterium]